MVKLANRTNLKQKAAESLTDPRFVGLWQSSELVRPSLTIRVKNGLPPEKRFRLELRHVADDTYSFRLRAIDGVYKGVVSLGENDGGYLADVRLDKLNGYRLLSFEAKGGRRDGIGYRDSSGNTVLLDNDQIKKVNYWVPTAINYITEHADGLAHRLGPAIDREISEPQTNISLDDCVDDGALEPTGINYPNRESPIPHFRSGHIKTRQVGGVDIEFGVTGCYVNWSREEWGRLAPAEILGSVREHANDMTPLYFENLAREITRSDLPFGRLMTVYRRSRTTSSDELQTANRN